MKETIKKLFGIDKIITAREKKKADLLAAEEAAKYSTMTEKERATAQGIGWVKVIEFHVNKDNIRNGFFDLDWNEYHIIDLRNSGYTGATDEEVVDKWFSEVCRDVGFEEGIDMSRRGSGFVQRALREDGRTEIG
jgi:hypothetical protein